MKKLGVIIGRFQPCHIGHVEGLFSRVQDCEKVIVLLGSSYQAQTPKNPWAISHRIQMIQESCAEANIDTSRYRFIPIRDYLYNDSAWKQQVLKIIDEESDSLTPVLYGVSKDPSTSAYLSMFPELKTDIISPPRNLSATDIRKAMFENTFDTIKDLVAPLILSSMKAYMQTSAGISLREDYEYNRHQSSELIMYQDEHTGQFRNSHRQLIGVTVDTLVIWREKFLMIERKRGGLLALPGGHLNKDERLIDGAMRELREETQLRIMHKDKEIPVTSWLWHGVSRVFDHPERSLAGRKISHTFLLPLVHTYECTVEAANDAIACHWIGIHDFKNNKDKIWSRCFEDHQFIIETMFGW